MSGSYDMQIYAGADFQITPEWKDENGVAINLTGWAAQLVFHRKSDLKRASETFNSPSDIVLGGVAGTIQISISNTKTAKMEGEYFYHLYMIAPSGKITALLTGSATVNP